jgi:hypothetical protein
LGVLGIRTSEGLNISAFLDHLKHSPQCCRAEGMLVDALNQAIVGEREV